MNEMKTLTITDAKKNLGKWLNAAARGEEIGIISGATILALQPVEVRVKPWHEAMSVDHEYIRKEYGMTPEQMEAALGRLEQQSARDLQKRSGIIIENPTPEKLEKAISDYARSHQPARRAATKRTRRRLARSA